MTQKRWRQKCGNQRLPKDLATDWLQMSFFISNWLVSRGPGRSWAAHKNMKVRDWAAGNQTTSDLRCSDHLCPQRRPSKGHGLTIPWSHGCFYSKEWLYAGSSHPTYCSFRSSPESRPQTGRPRVREESPEASPAPRDGESGAHLKVMVRPTTSHLSAAHPESMPRFPLHFCSYTTGPQTSW